MDIDTVKLGRKEMCDKDAKRMDAQIEKHEKGMATKGCVKLTDYMLF